ncbi:MAG: S8 family serine peptidase [Tahibacter sp.]
MRPKTTAVRSLSFQIAVALTAACSATTIQAAEIAAGLQAEAQRTGSVDTLIVLRAEAPKQLLRTDGDYLARRRALVELLRATADASQSDVRAWLEAEGVSYRPFWIVNMIEARLTAAQMNVLAARGDINRIASNQSFALQRPVEDTGLLPRPQSPEAIEWGVNKIKAPQVWALGINGSGVVVAGQDTGIRWTHGAIKAKYRGWDGLVADHNYNWHDSIHATGSTCGADSAQPCDDNGHGSHTVGTMVGDDGAGNQVGVAPGARFIGCRNMNAGNGTPATYNECAQWLLAPTNLAGLNPDPDKAPDVVSNSWGCPTSEGCVSGSEVGPAIENLIAGGIMFVAAAGNSGSSCSTITDAPGKYDNVFTIGSTTSADAISSFSGRGPVAGATRNKPDVVAPGSSVRSINNASDAGYMTISGTSMATPHVAGAAALLMQVNPALKGNPTAVADLLRSTAVPIVNAQVCGAIPGTTFPNPVQGYGQIDVLAAVIKADTLFADRFQ